MYLSKFVGIWVQNHAYNVAWQNFIDHKTPFNYDRIYFQLAYS